MRRWILFMLAMFTLIGCGAQTPEEQTTTAAAACRDVATAYNDAIQPVAQRWDDATKLASSTGRGNLPNQIGVLQQIKRDADAVEVPPCVTFAHSRLINSMDATINGFLAFMSQKEESAVNAFFTTARTEMSMWGRELAKATTGEPVK